MNVVLNACGLDHWKLQEIINGTVGGPARPLVIRSAADFPGLGAVPSDAALFLVVRWGRPDIDELVGGLERWRPSPNPFSPEWSLIGLIGAAAYRFDPIPKSQVDRNPGLSERLARLEDSAHLLPWNEQEAAHLFNVTPGTTPKVAELRSFYLEYSGRTTARKAG